MTAPAPAGSEGGADAVRMAGCTGKKRHRTAGDAVAFASRMVRKTGSVRPYGCQHCGGWHLTSRTFSAWDAAHG